MKILSDESTDSRIIRALRKEGHEIKDIKEESPGVTDEEVLRIANEYGMLLITEDKDFGELVYRMRMVNYGVVFIRLIGIPGDKKAKIVSKVIHEHEQELLNNFTVIEENKVRIRKR